MEIICEGEKSMSDVAKRLVEEFSNRRENEAFVVGLSGDLGAGKTTFTKEIARILEVGDVVVSPTFVIEKIYEIPHSVFKQMIHIDAYRLKSGAELSVLGWDELIKDPTNLIIIEWPENIKEYMPENTLYVTFEHVNEDSRCIKW